MEEEQRIENQGAPWKYYSVIPHLADDELDTYEYRLYGHYVRACGVGGRFCTEYTATTARKTGMSLGKVSTTRRSLEEKGYVSLHEIHRHGNKHIHVTLTDIWPRNMARYAVSPGESGPTVSPHETAVSPHETAVSPHETAVSPGETNKNNNMYKNNNMGKKEQVEEQQVVVVEMASQTPNSLGDFGNTRDAAARATYVSYDGLKRQALTWMREIPGWLARESYIDTLSVDETALLIHWLWIYRLRTNWSAAIDAGTGGMNLPQIFAEIRQPAAWIKWNIQQGNQPDMDPMELEALETYLQPEEAPQ